MVLVGVSVVLMLLVCLCVTLFELVCPFFVIYCVMLCGLALSCARVRLCARMVLKVMR